MSEDRPKNTIEKMLNLFTEVRAGEGYTATILCLSIFVLLAAYYIIKPVREALILTGAGSAEIKSYAAAGQAILLVMALPLYSWLASRFPRRHLINIVSVFFTGCLVLFYILARLDVKIGVIFYLWVGIFNLMVPAQFWAFANDSYSPADGKRLFVIIAFGASAGAAFGSLIAGQLIKPLGIYQLLILSGGLVLLSLVLINVVDSRQRENNGEMSLGVAASEGPLQKGNPFRLVLRHKYLVLLALLMLLLNWVNTNGEYHCCPVNFS